MDSSGIFALLEAAQLQSSKTGQATVATDLVVESGMELEKMIQTTFTDMKRTYPSKNLPLKKRQWNQQWVHIRKTTDTLSSLPSTQLKSNSQDKIALQKKTKKQRVHIRKTDTLPSTQSDSQDKTTLQTKTKKSNVNQKIIVRDRRKDEKWNAKFKDLVAFQQKYGHCNVASRDATHKSLGIWLQNQRQEYKMHIQSNKGPMIKERIDLLESVGVQWEVRNNTWGIRFEELKDYIRDNGHCNVSRSVGDNEKLGTWLHTQRKAYKLALRTDFKAGMTKQRMKLLESVGVEWGHGR
jgi:hypothetical protein